MACDSKATYMLPLNALQMRIGQTEVIAVVCTSSPISLMTQPLYDRIRNDSRTLENYLEEFQSEKIISGGGGKSVEIKKVIVFDAFLDECPVKLTVSVVEKCAADIILGFDFLSEIKSNFSIDRPTFKWKYNEHLKVSSFITDVEKLNKIDFFRTDNLLAKNRVSATKSEEPDTITGKSKPNDKSKNEKRNSSQGFQLKYYPPKNTTSSADRSANICKKTPSSTIEDGRATVYISTRRLINILGFGPPLGYYGIWWCDGCESNTIEGLQVEMETMIGLNCRAIGKALQQAQANGISRLRIIINRNEGLDLLRTYTKNKVIKKPGQTKCVTYEVYIMYREVCFLIDKMDEVKFEYFEDNKGPENLRNLREEVHKFIAISDGLRDDDQPGFFSTTLTLI